MVGGVETLFKENSNQVLGYANNAYKTAGMSANEYMNTITGFSASLLQGLSGDTKKAAEIGNKAVTDMSDNANKMGTSIGDIQNAYQGFAKQNYTMLDNLKLGYGGTKEEMKRLLVDAEKLSGIKYNINNFSDIIEAIHVVQTEIGITGTTALEASTTIEGSFNSMKSAWTNVLTGMADDTADFDVLVSNLVESIGQFGANILPRIKIALVGIGELISRLAGELPNVIMSVLPDVVNAGVQILSSLANSIMESLPLFIDLGIDVISSLLTGIQDNLPQIITSAIEIIDILVKGIVEMLPLILQMGIDIIVQLALGLANKMPELIPLAVSCVLTLVDTILDNIDAIIDAGIALIIALAEGLINALPQLIEKVPIIIEKLLTALMDNWPKLLKAGVDLVIMIAEGLIHAIPQLLSKIPILITSMLSAIGSFFRNFYETGGIIVQKIGDGLISMLGFAISNCGTLTRTILDSIKAGVVGVFDIGVNIVKGVWNGIASLGSWLGSKVTGFFTGIVDGAKHALGIKSPSRVFRDQVGKYMAQGVGVGFEDETENIQDSMSKNLSDLTAKMTSTVDYETSKTSTGVMARNSQRVSTEPTTLEDMKDGDVFIVKNYMDSDEISEYTYKKVDGKFALAGKRVR